MYLLKNLCYDERTKNVEVKNGLEIGVKNNTLVYLPDSFWGETQISLGHDTDFSKLTELNKEGEYLLPYVNEYFVVPLEDNFKKIIFNVSTYEENNVEGYIIFIKYGDNIKTNGEKLFGRYNCEIVVVLRDKNFLEFEGKRLEVINGKLMLYI